MAGAGTATIPGRAAAISPKFGNGTPSILARKGGTGKSTAVRCLAVEALKAGRKVVVIDTDPQPTCYR
jgi:putative protein kinase ArgK-like GTPase of G3E family